MRNPAVWLSSEAHQIQSNDECEDHTPITREQLREIIETLQLIDLGDAAFYLDDEGHLEAFLPLI